MVEDIQNLRHVVRENKEHSIGTSIKCVGHLANTHTHTHKVNLASKVASQLARK